MRHHSFKMLTLCLYASWLKICADVNKVQIKTLLNLWSGYLKKKILVLLARWVRNDFEVVSTLGFRLAKDHNPLL